MPDDKTFCKSFGPIAISFYFVYIFLFLFFFSFALPFFLPIGLNMNPTRDIESGENEEQKNNGKEWRPKEKKRDVVAKITSFYFVTGPSEAKKKHEWNSRKIMFQIRELCIWE